MLLGMSLLSLLPPGRPSALLLVPHSEGVDGDKPGKNAGFATRPTTSRGLGFTALFILRVVTGPFSGSKARIAHTASIKHVLERTCLEIINKRGKQNHHPGVAKKGQANQQHRIPIGTWKIPMSGSQRVVDSGLLWVLGKPRAKSEKGVVTEEGPGETRKEVSRLAG